MTSRPSAARSSPMDTILPLNRSEWRSWLESNHLVARGIDLVRYKKHVGKECISVNEAVEEAICFGWASDVMHRIDDERYSIRFYPRHARGSGWSPLNVSRAHRMIASDKMTQIGMERFRDWLKDHPEDSPPTEPVESSPGVLTGKKRARPKILETESEVSEWCQKKRRRKSS